MNLTQTRLRRRQRHAQAAAYRSTCAARKALLDIDRGLRSVEPRLRALDGDWWEARERFLAALAAEERLREGDSL